MEVSKREMRVLEGKKRRKTHIGVNYVLILSGTFYPQKFLFHYMASVSALTSAAHSVLGKCV